jgi:hypothetical protein
MSTNPAKTENPMKQLQNIKKYQYNNIRKYAMDKNRVK